MWPRGVVVTPLCLDRPLGFGKALPNPLHPFVVHRPASCIHHHGCSPITIAPVLLGQHDDVVSQLLIVI